MTTTTALLRTVARICDVEAAVVSIDAELVVYGLTASAAIDAVACVHAEQPLPAGRILIAQMPIPLVDVARAAVLYLFDRTAAPIASAYAAVIRAIATEIGSALDARPVSQRNHMSAGFGAVMARLAAGIDSLNDAAAIYEWPRIGSSPRIVYNNRAFEELFGYAASATIGQSAAILYGPLTKLDLVEFLRDRIRATGEGRSPIVYYRRDGVPVWVDLSVRGVSGAIEGAACVVATMRDITMRKEFELAIGKEKRKLQVTLAAIGEGVITTVADGRVDFVNDAARTIFGIDAAEAYGEPLADVLRLSSNAGATIDVLSGPAKPVGPSRGQAQFGRGTAVKHIAYVTSPIGHEGFVVVLRDVTAQHRLATQLTYEASHDPLTNIYNRRKFDELLEDAIDSARGGAGPYALAFLDLDRFKEINDRCGHAVGDRLLLDLAHVLQHQLRGRDVLARIGGDEFAVLLHDCSLENARRVLEKLRRAVESHRVRHLGREYSVGVSIGVTAIDNVDLEPAAIFDRADRACYEAKSRGRNAIAG